MSTTTPDLSGFAAAVRFRDRCTAAAVTHHERAGLAPSEQYARATYDAIAELIREDERRRLAEAGRLLPASGETRIEWGVRLTWDDEQFEDCPRPNEPSARGMFDYHDQKRRGGDWQVTPTLIQRTHAASPWQPVPPDKES